MRQSSEVLYREDTGVVLATRPSVIKSNRRIGDNVKIVVNDDEYSGIDIHTEESFYLAEKVVEKELQLKNSEYCF